MTLATAPGTQALIALEEAAPDVLFECLPGTAHPLWPQVRSSFMLALQNLDYGSGDIEAPEPSRASVWVELVRAMLPSTWDARGLRHRKRIVHLAGGRTIYRVSGRERNWLLGDYLDVAPDDSALIQWAPASGAPAAFPVTRSFAPAVTRSAAYARLSRPRRASTLDAIPGLVAEFARLLGGLVASSRVEAIAESAVYQEANRPHVEREVLRVFDRLQPRVALFEDASYGPWSSLIAQLKARDVRVVEPQHGWIGPSHGAYNFGAAMWQPQMAVGLPDELLTFGDYWSAGLRTPYPHTSIGKPHLEASAAAATPWDERERDVLVVSSVVDPEGTSTFVAALAGALPEGWRVSFRPHPSERATLATRYPRLVTHARVAIDENADVYDSLRASRAVIGVASTVLFEALAFGCRVFARESPTSDYYVGHLFGDRVHGVADIPRLVADLASPAVPLSPALVTSIWKPRAVENFTTWLESGLRPRD
jgi:hypothetical protein